MEFTSKNMYDTYKEKIWKELGPLDPNWFEVLTRQASAEEASVSDQDELCANQEGNFKVPSDRTALNSQPFSTPKAFRHRSVVSPLTQNDSFTPDREKDALCWTAVQSPRFFGMTKQSESEVKNEATHPQSEISFELLHTPHKSQANHAQRISESLGAQMNPDISWTSSLNTPPAVPSTLILTKNDVNLSPGGILADEDVVVARKLFPSRSKVSKVGFSPQKHNEIAAIFPGTVTPEAEPPNVLQPSFKQTEGSCHQNLPDEFKDGERSSPNSSAPDGADKAVPVFFANSSSALRKVNPGRFLQKQVLQTVEHSYSSPGPSTRGISTTENNLSEQNPPSFPVTPPISKPDPGPSQWSPLSLSQIPACTADSTVLAKPSQSHLKCEQPAKQQRDIASGLLKKKRRFVYNIGALKSPAQRKETPSPKMKSTLQDQACEQEGSVPQVETVPDEKDCSSNLNKVGQSRGFINQDKSPPPAESKVQDCDMSQLCKEFATDFSQIGDPGDVTEALRDRHMEFSPSVCLSAVKRAKHKESQAKSQRDLDRAGIKTLTDDDSGFLSAALDVTASTVALPGPSNNSVSGRSPCLKTFIHRPTHIQSTSKSIAQEDSKALTEISQNSELDFERSFEFHTDKEPQQRAISDPGSLPGETSSSLSSFHTSGFKTASHKAITISSANLEKAKLFLEEAENLNNSTLQPSECSQTMLRNPLRGNEAGKHKASELVQICSVKEPSNDTCPLTASQKADVTELCTLLEEADSQFEFTQFKTAEINNQAENILSPKAEKELDSDLLTGIDFNDSFSSDAPKDKAPSRTSQKGSQAMETTGFERSAEERTSLGEPNIKVFSFGMDKVPEDSGSLEYPPKNEQLETNEWENGNLVVERSFKTAEKSVEKISNKCLIKAKTLFVDLEEIPANEATGKPSTEKHNLIFNKRDENPKVIPKIHTEQSGTALSDSVCSDKPVAKLESEDAAKHYENAPVSGSAFKNGFQMASGKAVSISARHLEQAHDLFREFDIFQGDCSTSGQEVNVDKTVTKNTLDCKKLSKLKNLRRKSIAPDDRLDGDGATVSTNERFREERSFGEPPTPRLSTIPKIGGIPRTAGEAACHSSALVKSFGKSDVDFGINEIEPPISVHGRLSKPGFIAASGKPVTLSSEALRKAKALFSDITLESPTSSDTKRTDQKWENISKVSSVSSTATERVVYESGKSLSKHSLEALHGIGSPKAMAENMPCNVVTSRVCNKERDTLKFEPDLKKSVGIKKTPKLKTQSVSVFSAQNRGFQTASGKEVKISLEALKKAQNLMNECETLKDAIGEIPQHSDDPLSGPSFHTSGSPGAKQVVVSSGASQMTKAVFCDNRTNTDKSTPSQFTNNNQVQASNLVPAPCEELRERRNPLSEPDGIDLPSSPSSIPIQLPPATTSQVVLPPVAKQKSTALTMMESVQNVAVPGHLRTVGCGFTNAKGQKISVSHKGLLEAKRLMKEFVESVPIHLNEKDEFGEKHATPSNDMTDAELVSEVCDVKKVTAHLNVVESSFDKGCEVGTISTAKEKPTPLPSQKHAFQTAAGKGVTISARALEQAKILLSENERVNDDIDENPSRLTVSGSCPPNKPFGFSAASGKPIGVSSNALLKAKALFSDIHLSASEATASDTGMKKGKDQRRSVGFQTAGGVKVHVSEESLLKASKLLNSCIPTGGQNSHSTLKGLPGSQHRDPSTEKNIHAHTLPTTDETETLLDDPVSLVKSPVALHEPSNAGEDRESGATIQEGNNSPASLTHNIPKRQCLLVSEGNQVACCQKSKILQTVESSLDEVHVLNLADCTETQEMLVVQEALDCTEALLQDEGLTGHSLSLALEREPVHETRKCSDRSFEEYQRKGKRRLADQKIPDQPPLKRRLLADFEKTVGGTNTSVLEPVKCCPNALMKDRGNFLYSDSLQPHITRPHWSAKGYFETKSKNATPTNCSTTAEGQSLTSKTPAFVPPFIRNVKPKISESAMTRGRTKTSVFVPPFKKQRAIVQDVPLQPQVEEEGGQSLNLKPSTSTSKYPTENTKDTADGGPYTDNTAAAVITNQSLTVGGRAEAASTETSLFSCQGLQRSIELARDMQDMRIRKKKRQTVRPLPGTLYSTKTSGVERIPLKAAVNGTPPSRYSPAQLYSFGVHKHVSEVFGDTAESFRFGLLQYFKEEVLGANGGVQLGDGGWLIPSVDGTAGKEEFYRALCDTPGVDPKLISEAWVHNHYRWIVWKQASMEKSFPEVMGSRCLTPEQVLLQLKYRYDVEVDHSRRPALRKITEKDDTPAKTLILCVCGVVSAGLPSNEPSRNDTKTPQGVEPKPQSPAAVVWLTDGWYAIKAQLDKPLTAMLRRGRLAVGGKLMVHGAQLVGSQDACPPLDAPESLMLKICANSSRPARWDVKLGFYKDPRPFLLPVSCLYSDGGPVGCVDVVILRSYPIQWMERKPDGVVFRSVRAEEKEVRRYNTRKQIALEALFVKLQAELEQEEQGEVKSLRRRQSMNHRNIASLQDGEELYEAVGDDPAHLQARLSEQQLETLQRFRQSLMDKKQAQLQDRYRRALQTEGSELSFPKRDVTTVWRLCFADTLEESSRVYQLNLWRPSADLQCLLKEGGRYKVYSLSTSEGKKRGCVEGLQFTGTKKTQFEEMQVPEEWITTRFQQRVSTTYESLHHSDFQPLCGEVDLTGFVVSVVDGLGTSSAFFLSDGEMNFLKVRCFSSLVQLGLEDVVKPGVLLALSNLQLKGQSLHPTPVVYAGDLTVFSTNPKETHLQDSLKELRNRIQGQENFVLTVNETLSHLMDTDGRSSIHSPAPQPQTPASTSDTGQDRQARVSCPRQSRSLGSFTPVNRNPAAVIPSTEKDPKSLKRKRALDFLSRIPSPPPLANLSPGVSPCVKKTFNPPRRSGTPSTLTNVRTPAPKPPEGLQSELVNDEELAMIDTQALHFD